MALPPPTGQNPLSDNEAPQWGGRGGGIEAGSVYAWNDFRQLFGRNPTRAELNQLASGYVGGDPNIANVGGGRALVSQYYQNFMSNPEYQREQAEQNAPGQFDQVNQAFKSQIGRDATDEEKKHFGAMLSAKQLDLYTLGQFLQQTPEALNAADKKFREEVTGDLQNQGERYFSEKILPAIQQSFLRSGRSVDSSGYAAMLAKAAQEQNTQRESFLTNLTAQQYQGNKQNATSDYNRVLDQYYGNQNYGRQRSDYLTDNYTKRLQDMNDFQLQQQAYDSYLRRYGKRSFADKLSTGLNLANSTANLFKGWMPGSSPAPVNTSASASGPYPYAQDYGNA